MYLEEKLLFFCDSLPSPVDGALWDPSNDRISACAGPAYESRVCFKCQII